VTRIKTVGANSRLTVAIDAEDPSLANTVAWLKVASSIPIAAERAVFWPGPAGTWIESHGGNGSPDAGVHWTLAEGASGGPLGFESFLVIANPSASDAQVRVTYLRENGATVVKTYTVGALQRRTIHVNAAVPELVHEPFGADIRSTNGVPIVVERSMYWNAFQGGTSATATRVP
jgi:hypothetical protein